MVAHPEPVGRTVAARADAEGSTASGISYRLPQSSIANLSASCQQPIHVRCSPMSHGTSELTWFESPEDIRLLLTAGVLRLWEDALTKVKTRSVEAVASGRTGGIICNQLRFIEGLVRRTGLEKARAITLLGQVFPRVAARPTVGLAAVGWQSSIAAGDSAIHRK